MRAKLEVVDPPFLRIASGEENFFDAKRFLFSAELQERWKWKTN